MIGRIESAFRRLRRGISRSEWFIRLLGLPVARGTETTPGLVMLQIDGLSGQELERALKSGEMPFLGRLMDREHYRLHRHYAGVPATTAAVQGELFYGVKAGVPGFNFMERASGDLVRMFEPAAAARAERDLEARGGQALLRGGSSYADNFTGGAAEPHFCPSSQGWGPALRQANPLAVAIFVLSNAYSFMRTIILLVLETVIAISDCIRGIVDGENVLKELTFVPTRVVITILLRELATIGAKIDVARGLPIVHVNFLGYDEQAHRRGPSSYFAHWTLKGIDDATARIWRAAHRSARRRYDVWIYSDHGQERVQPYDQLHGRSLADAIARTFAEHQGRSIRYRSSGQSGEQLQRARLFGGRKVQRLCPVGDLQGSEPDAVKLTVAALGPIAMVYYERELQTSERNWLARALAQQAKVPLVLVADGPGRAYACLESQEFALPEDAARILGDGHPYLEEATRDLVDLCHHPDAGDFVVCGWRAGVSPVSFAVENGAHGGAGPNETNAFALLPGDAPLPVSARNYLRPSDLRNAALQFLGRAEGEPAGRARRPSTQKSLRIMTYNVHSCIGMDGKLSPERIARVIARYQPDIVALQELDIGRARTEGVDQAHLIARHLEMDFHFQAAMHVAEEQYGDAILSHLPVRLIKGDVLPGLPGKLQLEPRGALWVAIDVAGTEFHVLNTHLGLLPRERLIQTEALLGPDWLGHADCRGPVLLCGDFNALPSSPVFRRLNQRLKDAQSTLVRHRPRGTFFGRFAAGRIDHVFIDATLDVVDVEVPNTELTRVASDHLPLIIDVQRASTPQ